MARILFVLGLAACTPEGLETAPTDAESAAARGWIDGTPEAVAMLDFLNAESTTHSVLDDMLALDRRAADSLIHYRNGADGELGTPDDDLYDTVQEVDDRYWVGDATMGRIVWWLGEHEMVPQGDDVLGTWDGVTVTVNEADAMVWLANDASANELDDGLDLDSRAVDSILAARPILSVQHLSEQYYVGQSALVAIRDAAKAR